MVEWHSVTKIENLALMLADTCKLLLLALFAAVVCNCGSEPRSFWSGEDDDDRDGERDDDDDDDDDDEEEDEEDYDDGESDDTDASIEQGDDTNDQASDAAQPGDTETEPHMVEPCADLYAESLMPTFEVQISDAEWDGMAADCRREVKAYRPIVFRFGDESKEAMMRLKGNWSWTCDKMQFVISFNEVDPDGRFHGLRKIVMDAPWYDASLLHERLAFFFLERYGAPYSCVNNARLFINGAYYGVYANVERIDREYLERHFDDPDGNLYKEGKELKTNEETANTSRMDAFWAASTLDALQQLVEIPQVIELWAGLAMMPDPDSYWAGVEINFYLYDHPTRGFLFLPYDADIAFGEELWPDLYQADPLTYEHPEWLREDQYLTVLSDPSWCAAFEAALGRAYDAYDIELMASKVDTWSAQIAAAVEEDPNRTFTIEEHLAALESLRSFPTRRAQFVATWLQGTDHCPLRQSTFPF
jgi:hypothetical protein